ncbi:MAG: site-specific DNA-methyltransferase [Muribaculaceae bacterium]|nr:site-specific DNA-methyltransferase [Muribaculaceae bacterium]
MEVLKEMPDLSFDLAIVDPPYFSGPERRGFYGSQISSTGIKRRNYPKSEKWIVPDKRYFKELERVSKYYIVWGCNYFNYIFAPGRIIWDKCNQSSSFSDCEIAATNLFSSVRLLSCGMVCVKERAFKKAE